MRNKPPLGLRPKSVVDWHRMCEISDAISRYSKDGRPIPKEWTEELNEISVRFSKLSEIKSEPTDSKKDWRVEIRRLSVLTNIVLSDTIPVTPVSEKAFRELEKDGLITVQVNAAGYQLTMTKEGQKVVDKISAVLGFNPPFNGKRYSLNCNQTMIILDCYRGTSTQKIMGQHKTDCEFLVKRGMLIFTETGYDLTEAGRELALTILTVSVL